MKIPFNFRAYILSFSCYKLKVHLARTISLKTASTVTQALFSSSHSCDLYSEKSHSVVEEVWKFRLC